MTPQNENIGFHYRPDLHAPQSLTGKLAEVMFAAGVHTPVEYLIQRILEDNQSPVDPRTNLPCAITARVGEQPGQRKVEAVARYVPLSRNPHILRWQMNERLWPDAEADLYVETDANGNRNEVMATITTPGMFVDDTAPAPPQTPLTLAWLEAAERNKARGKIWQIGGDGYITEMFRQRAAEVWTAMGLDYSRMESFREQISAAGREEAIALQQKIGGLPGMSYCPEHHTVTPAGVGCGVCAKRKRFN